jgi:hypothetical protein
MLHHGFGNDSPQFAPAWAPRQEALQGTPAEGLQRICYVR